MRNFDEEFALDEREGQSFILAGHEFHTRAVLHPSIFLTDESGIRAGVSIIRGMLSDEDKVVFDGMIDDPDVLISVHQIDEIAAWLMKESSGRPTKRPGSFGNGAGRTGNGSKAASPSRAKTGD